MNAFSSISLLKPIDPREKQRLHITFPRSRFFIGLVWLLAEVGCQPAQQMTRMTLSPVDDGETVGSGETGQATTSVPQVGYKGVIACPVKALRKLSELRKRYPFPEYLNQKDAVKRGGEFDVNSYFEIFKHLSMKPGYVLDYVYSGDRGWGGPRLYERRKNDRPYRTASELVQDRPTAKSPRRLSTWIDHVRVDGSPEGYFELIVLSIVADQFYLFWHANYNDKHIVCDRGEMESLLTYLAKPGFGKPMTDGQIETARSLDLSPFVEIGKHKVKVVYLVFSKWGGFERVYRTTTSAPPYEVIERDSKTEVPYNCGVIF